MSKCKKTWNRMLLLAAAVQIGQASCSAIRTTPMTRHANEELSVDECSPLKGVPVMLKVPSHLEVEIIETTYYDYCKDGQLQPVYEVNPARRASVQLRYIEKMILVDPVRPFSGQGGYGFGFTGPPTATGLPPDANQGNGYLGQFSYTATDTTIKDTATLLATVAPLVGITKAAATPSTAPLSDSLIKLERTIALRRFDLAMPNLQGELQCFLDTHIIAQP